MAWRHPLDKFKLGSGFMVIDKYHTAPGHRGTDYNGVPEGTPVKAVNDGTIALNKWSDVLGHVVVLRTASRQYFGYCHLKEASPLAVGTAVKSGDVVGKLGNTGSASFGAHLHFAGCVKPEGVFAGQLFDAYKFIEEQIKAQKANPVAPKATPEQIAQAAAGGAFNPDLLGK